MDELLQCRFSVQCSDDLQDKDRSALGPQYRWVCNCGGAGQWLGYESACEPAWKEHVARKG